MKRILTSAFIIMLAIGSASAQETNSKGHEGHKKEHKMGYDQLNLTADQKSRLQSIREDFKKQSAELKNNSQLSAEEKQARRKELHQQFRTQSQTILTPEQKEQLSKMKADRKTTHKTGKGKWNKDGATARKSAGRNFHKELGLSAEQQQKVSSIRSEFKPRFETLRSDNSLSQEQKKEKMRALMTEQQAQMKAVLTPEQIQKMNNMRQKQGRKK